MHSQNPPEPPRKSHGCLTFVLGLIIGIGMAVGSCYLASQAGLIAVRFGNVIIEKATLSDDTKADTKTDDATDTKKPDGMTDAKKDETQDKTQGKAEKTDEAKVIETEVETPAVFQEWPEAEIGDLLPKPGFDRKPTSATVSESAISIVYEDASEEDATAYAEDVRGAGYTIQPTEVKSDGRYSYNAYKGEDINHSPSVKVFWQAASDEAPAKLHIVCIKAS